MSAAPRLAVLAALTALAVPATAWAGPVPAGSAARAMSPSTARQDGSAARRQDISGRLRRGERVDRADLHWYLHGRELVDPATPPPAAMTAVNAPRVAPVPSPPVPSPPAPAGPPMAPMFTLRSGVPMVGHMLQSGPGAHNCYRFPGGDVGPLEVIVRSSSFDPVVSVGAGETCSAAATWTNDNGGAPSGEPGDAWLVIQRVFQGPHFIRVGRADGAARGNGDYHVMGMSRTTRPPGVNPLNSPTVTAARAGENAAQSQAVRAFVAAARDAASAVEDEADTLLAGLALMKAQPWLFSTMDPYRLRTDSCAALHGSYSQLIYDQDRIDALCLTPQAYAEANADLRRMAEENARLNATRPPGNPTSPVVPSGTGNLNVRTYDGRTGMYTGTEVMSETEAELRGARPQ